MMATVIERNVMPAGRWIRGLTYSGAPVVHCTETRLSSPTRCGLVPGSNWEPSDVPPVPGEEEVCPLCVVGSEPFALEDNRNWWG